MLGKNKLKTLRLVQFLQSFYKSSPPCPHQDKVLLQRSKWEATYNCGPVVEPQTWTLPKSASGLSKDFWFCLPLTLTDHTHSEWNGNTEIIVYHLSYITSWCNINPVTRVTEYIWNTHVHEEVSKSLYTPPKLYDILSMSL